MITRIALVAALAALGACADARSGPPIAGESRGTGAPPLRQQVEQQPHSGNASAGSATITGTDGQGRPTIDRTGPAGGGIGGVGPAPRSPGSQGGGRGG
ncbi:hypothetical protein JMJ55_17155 [Belnapia sp. T6]|uniref:Lipoprotein n=1 Tax=Belnapia mucosa TaxID=2804532 RepID=A0ABS1V5V4_9PROT|nr:hypothetical protein [Belnapia mucosa]MBL6457067.1 hypothetical protein [Belnapia mucosa]